MKIFIGVAILAAIGVATVPFNTEPQDVIRAQRFELLDREGRVRVELNVADGNPLISLKDGEGNDRLVLTDKPSGTGVYIKDAAGQTRVGVAQFPHGGGIAMHGAEGKGSAVYVLINDEARIEIYDKQGTKTDRWPPVEK